MLRHRLKKALSGNAKFLRLAYPFENRRIKTMRPEKMA